MTVATVSASALLSSVMLFNPLHLAQFLRDDMTYFIKLHISIHYDIVSILSVSFAGQSLSLTYLTLC